MATIPIRTEHDRAQAIKRIQSVKLPSTLNITKGAPRTIEQNKLQRKWMNELGEQGDMTDEDYRAHCKLHYGIPILLAENGDFAEQYNRIIRPLPYEQKLELMKAPIDFPVTRLMTTKQKVKYLDEVYRTWTAEGFRLTDPNWQGMEVV